MNISRQYVVNMQQNLLQYAPKRIAFSIKTCCILHQNAIQYATNCHILVLICGLYTR